MSKQEPIDSFFQALAQRSKQANQPTLKTEALSELLKETYEQYLLSRSDAPQVGDLVVQRDYMGAFVVPNTSSPGILHEVWAKPRPGYELSRADIGMYAAEMYDCVVAVLHQLPDGATLMFVPMNTRRLTKYKADEAPAD